MAEISALFSLIKNTPSHHVVILKKDERVTPEANTRAWSAFSRAIEACGEESARILERLRERYHIEVKKDSTEPLLVRHVRAFQVARADFLRRDFLEAELSRDRVAARVEPFSLEPEDSLGKLEGGVESMHFSELTVGDLVSADRKRLWFCSGVEKLSWDAYLERIAKAIISHPLQKGMLIPAPDGEGGRDYYEIVHLGGKRGLEICALYPIDQSSSLTPLILFQPTQFALAKQGVATLLNGIEPRIGSMGYEASREIVREVMSDARFARGNVEVAAYSLGGVHAQFLLEEYPDRVARAVFFNDAAPTDETAVRYADKVNAPSWDKEVEIVVYRNVLEDGEGNRYEDWTQAFGGKHIGWGITNPCVRVKVIELHYVTKKHSPARRHTLRCLDKVGSWRVELPREQINAALDVTKRKGVMGCFERIRRWIVSNLIYPVMHFVWSLCREVLNFFIGVVFGGPKAG